MSKIPYTSGEATFDITTKEGQIQVKTHYVIAGKLTEKSVPLVVIHGGPGAGHEYMLDFAAIWRDYGIPVVFYDQVGCGASTRLPQTVGDESLWQVDHFIRELNDLIDHLNLRKGYHILGQSWGGRVAAAFAVGQPDGLRKLILASAISSTATYLEDLKLLRSRLDPELQRAFLEEEQGGTIGSPRWKDALNKFMKAYAYRSDQPPPANMIIAYKHMEEDSTVRMTLVGPSLFDCSGSLRDWTVVPLLGNIKAPTLVYRGEYDTSGPLTTKPLIEIIPNVRTFEVPDAGHFCHLETPKRRSMILASVGQFLVE